MNTEEYIKLIEISTTEYMDKHHHYWNIYWKFLVGLAFIMSLYVFGEKNISLYIQINRRVTAAIFILIIALIGLASFTVLSREHIHLLEIQERCDVLYAQIHVTRTPGNDQSPLLKIERFLGSKISIASILSVSIVAIAVLSIALIVVSTHFGLPSNQGGI